MGERMPNYEQDYEPAIDRNLVIGRLRELGVQEDLGYLLDEDEMDDNVLMGEIVMLADMYDFDMDDVLPETLPIESRTRNELGIPLQGEF